MVILLNELKLRGNMKTFSVSCNLDLEAESEEHAYEVLLDYLHETVKMEDVTIFDFKEVEQ
jgi:hypothetical protein